MSQDTRTYIVLEAKGSIVITLTTSEVFKATEYRLGTTFVTARGQWAGTKGAVQTLMIPITAISTINMAAEEVSEDQIPADKKEIVGKQVEIITGSKPQG